MKKLLILAFIALALWQGSKHYRELIHRRPAHQAVVMNESGGTMERVRLVVGGQTFVRESLADGDRATFPFNVNEDGTFQLVWEENRGTQERSWSGGMVPRGPLVQRFEFSVHAGGTVTFRTQAL